MRVISGIRETGIGAWDFTQGPQMTIQKCRPRKDGGIYEKTIHKGMAAIMADRFECSRLPDSRCDTAG